MLPTQVESSPFLLLYKPEPWWPLGEAMMWGGHVGDLPDEAGKYTS